MINRLLKDKIFNLTKKHKFEYYKHSYYKSKYSYNLILEGKITKQDLQNEEIRYNLFKIYFEENIFNNENQCIEFFKNKYMEKFNITEDISNEIKNAKRNVKYKNNSILNIINLI